MLVLSSLYPPHAIGGYENACHDVMSRWAAEGHQVTVLSSNAWVPGVLAPDPPGLGVRRQFTLLYNGPPGSAVPRRRSVPGAVVRDLRSLRRALRDVRPDVVSLWHPGGLSLALVHALARQRVPVVSVVCDHWPVYAPGADPTPFVGRRAAPVPGTAVFCSAALRRVIEAGTGRQFPESRVVWLGVDHATFPVESPAGVRPWRWRLLYAGRLSPEKGVPTAVRALALLPPEATLDLVGWGDARIRTDLEILAASLGVGERVTITTRSRAELPTCYRQADALLFPSEWEEPFGIVPLEAMAVGTPVVATGAGGSGEYLRNRENCLLYPPGDASALAMAVRTLQRDPALRSAIVSGGTATAAAVSTDRLAAELLIVHTDAAGVPSSRV